MSQTLRRLSEGLESGKGGVRTTCPAQQAVAATGNSAQLCRGLPAEKLTNASISDCGISRVLKFRLSSVSVFISSITAHQQRGSLRHQKP
eukprot:4315907-Amphidinium_carterae.1